MLVGNEQDGTTRLQWAIGHVCLEVGRGLGEQPKVDEHDIIAALVKTDLKKKNRDLDRKVERIAANGSDGTSSEGELAAEPGSGRGGRGGLPWRLPLLIRTALVRSLRASEGLP